MTCFVSLPLLTFACFSHCYSLRGQDWRRGIDSLVPACEEVKSNFCKTFYLQYLTILKQ